MRFNRQVLRSALDMGVPIRQVADRATGRTTAAALGMLAQAIANPGTTLKIVDHFGTIASDREMSRVMQEMVNKLGLSGFTFTSQTVVNNFSEVVTR